MHPERHLRAGLLALSALAFAARFALAAPIVIGQGPTLGLDRAGDAWYQEFQDWTHADLRALDPVGTADAVYHWNDGYDDSRDLAGFYSRFENTGAGDNLYFRVDLYDLRLGAENGHLDVYVAIDCASGGQLWLPDFLDVQTDRPWEVCLGVYRSGTTAGSDFRLYDQAFAQPWNNRYLGAYFNSELDVVEFGIRRQTLLDAGWDGVSAVTFQVFTSNDGAETACTGGGRSSDIADAIVDVDRGCNDGTLNGGISATATAGLVYYATIAHGNQSVNQADDIGAHIYDPEATTGIRGGTGFLRTLDTHRLFGVPINLHPSGTLTTACLWASKPGGASDPQDGPSFVQQIREFVDPDQGVKPGALIGGVFAEHIMPYFEGPVNARSLAVTDSLQQVVYGVSAAQAKVMHTPERVIRSQSTGSSPLDGNTFEDIAASPYQATVIDEVTHLHHWFYSGEGCTPDAGYRHKVHKVNGVYCFVINDREDQGKFGNFDGGAVLDTRFSLLQKALFGNSSESVVVFDDWEALAGKSFDAVSGNSVPNNNPNQYHRTIRWLANHPWVSIVNLKDLLGIAQANPAAFVIDHGNRLDLGVQTYEWLKHANENSYHYWYYNSDAGFTGNEQSFYDLVPVITGPQGDYRARGATPANDGAPLPSGKKHGDMNTPGTLMYDTWARLQQAPQNRLRVLGEWSFLAMIYETAWHEENELDYSDTDCYGNWNFPDGSWDGVNTWALRLQNHVRQGSIYAAAALWADSVKRGLWPVQVVTRATDVDLDGEAEYVIANRRAYTVFERYGGRCVLACVYDAARGDAEVIVGAPVTNPSAPGEEEYTGVGANRCSAFKDVNGGGYTDAPYAATVFVNGVPGSTARGWQFVSPDGKVNKFVSLEIDSSDVHAHYSETVTGPLYVRFGLSPNPLDLIHQGQAHLASTLLGDRYRLANSAGGAAQLEWPAGASFNPAPSFAGTDRRNLALTEEVELFGDGDFDFTLRLRPDTSFSRPPVAAIAEGGALAGVALAISPTPTRAGTTGTLWFTLREAAEVHVELLDASGRRVVAHSFGHHEPGILRASLAARDASGDPLAPGLYFVRVSTENERAQRRWVVLR
ncbi:MAG: T9SS type A sorting domain-containing protein [Candidatus Eisenbacteria bacterium]